MGREASERDKYRGERNVKEDGWRDREREC